MIFSHVGQTKPISSKRILYIFDYTCLYLYTQTNKAPDWSLPTLAAKAKRWHLCTTAIGRRPEPFSDHLHLKTGSNCCHLHPTISLFLLLPQCLPRLPQLSLSQTLQRNMVTTTSMMCCSKILRSRWSRVVKIVAAAEWCLTYTCKTRSRKHTRREWKRSEQYRYPFWSRYTMNPALNWIRTTITWTPVSVMNNIAREQEDKIIILTQYSSTCRYKINMIQSACMMR